MLHLKGRISRYPSTGSESLTEPLSDIIPLFALLLNSVQGEARNQQSDRPTSVAAWVAGLCAKEAHHHQWSDEHFDRGGQQEQGDHQEDEDLDQISNGEQQALADGETRRR